MDKALEMGKTSATGSFHLLIGVAGSTIIMAIGTLVLNSMLPVSGVGLYGMALIPSSIINFFRDWGVNYALTQQIASLRSQNKEAQIHDIILSAVIFEIITGVILSLVCFAIASPLAAIISKQNPAEAGELTTYISIMSLSIFAGAILSAAGGIFTGFERMKLNSFTQILQAIVKTALGPLLIVLGFGVLGAIYATTVSIIAGGIVGIAIVYFAVFRPLRRCKEGKCDVRATLKPMLVYGLPLTFSNSVVGVLPLVINFAMAVYAGSTMMGNYYSAAYFSVLLTFITIPVATALFPTFSKLQPEREPELVKTVFASSVKYTSILLAPATMALIALSTPLIGFLFPSEGILHSLFTVNATLKFPYAPVFLALSCLVNLLVLFGNISLGTFQTGIGKTKQVMRQGAASLLIGLPFAYFLVYYLGLIGGPSYAVVGGILGILVAAIPAAAWGFYWCWKNYKVKADFGSSARIFAASAIAALITFLFVNFVALPYVITLVLGIVLFMVVYLVAAPLLGAVNQTDINNFKSMSSGLGFIAIFLNPPLLLMQRFCRPSSPKKDAYTAN